MEEEGGAPMVFGDLNKNVCKECGLPLKVYSFEKHKNDHGEQIIIKLFCQNLDHKKINELNFEEYNYFVQECLDKLCQCTLCLKLLWNTTETPPYYCYTCKKIICPQCLKDKHEKDHKDCFKFEDLQNKCLIHSDSKNEIQFYCIVCKKGLCTNCAFEDFDHIKKHDIKKIDELKNQKIYKDTILNIQKEQDYKRRYLDILQKKIENLKNQLEFQNFLLNQKNNYFHLFFDEKNNINLKANPININNNDNNKYPLNNKNDINNQINNSINNINVNNVDNNIDNNKKNIPINIIYHDENMKFQGLDIVLDCQKIQQEIKASLILTNDLLNLDILINYLIKINSKSKFFLIINGSSADNTLNFIKKKKYSHLFIKGCIYTASLDKYSKIQKKHSDIIERICIDCFSIINFIKSNAEKYKEHNEKLKIDLIMNWYSYKKEYFYLHRELSTFYGEESENVFTLNFSAFLNFIKSGDFSNEEKESLLNCCGIFSELNKKNYEKIIIQYLKDNNFSKIFNSLLNSKDIATYKKISYFAGNFMHCLVEYGKKAKKGINSEQIFYKGMQLPIINVLEFLKNRNLKITFPYFFSMVTNKDLVGFFSKRNIPDKERKEKGFYSVILTISYLHDDGFEPCVIDLTKLAQYPDEEEYILLPFTFLKLKNIIIDSNKLIADIELEIVGKKEILEYKLKDKKELQFDDKANIMFIK